MIAVGSGGVGGGVTNMCAGGTVGGNRPVDVRVFASMPSRTPPAPLRAPLLHRLAVAHRTQSGGGLLVDLAVAHAYAISLLRSHLDGSTKDSKGNEFWNATDACCNADGSTVDDSGYLSALLWDIRAQYNVDPNRVYVFGHGNGGFMAYRMACDHSLQVSGVASLGGAT